MSKPKGMGRIVRTYEEYLDYYGEEEIMERAKAGTFDSVVESWCQKCGNDVTTEPDADQTYCYCCEEVTYVDNPIEIMFLGAW
jgi:hypothetical protein